VPLDSGGAVRGWGPRGKERLTSSTALLLLLALAYLARTPFAAPQVAEAFKQAAEAEKGGRLLFGAVSLLLPPCGGLATPAGLDRWSRCNSIGRRRRALRGGRQRLLAGAILA